MSATAVAYWGQLRAAWETSTDSTVDIVPETEFAEPNSHDPRQVVFVIAAHEEGVLSSPPRLRYRLGGLPPISQVLLMEAPQTFSRFASAGTFTLKNIDSIAWRGFFPLRPTRRILFSETMEFPIKKLKRLTPRISLDYLRLEDDDA